MSFDPDPSHGIRFDASHGDPARMAPQALLVRSVIAAGEGSPITKEMMKNALALKKLIPGMDQE
ncbi:hypothetical protein DMH26_21525 [Streptomyces sp. WAC 05379]|uniref:hypothetical protein n=1 Tax=Streptomyces sp. WAC 05379 TaxID=2203207 RepID=UPI000F73EA4C|nr:hypothetical protein [Streptomyces sp. WAC 05379]RSN95463.1 hypothetical protein DMH26_21525 [Streptomyces sp. WAC 05379]